MVWLPPNSRPSKEARPPYRHGFIFCGHGVLQMSRTLLRYYRDHVDHEPEWQMPIKFVTRAGLTLVLNPDADDDAMVSEVCFNEKRLACSPAQFQEVAKLFAALRCRVVDVAIQGLIFSQPEPAAAQFNNKQGSVEVIPTGPSGLRLRRRFNRFRISNEEIALKDIKRLQITFDIDPRAGDIAASMLIDAKDRVERLDNMNGGISILAHLAMIYYRR